MQLTGLLLLVACLQVSAATYAQEMTIRGEDIPLRTVFKEIRKQTGYNFIFSSKALKKAHSVTLQKKDAELLHILNVVFKDQPLSYAIEDRLIIVSPEKEKKIVEGGGEVVAEQPDRQITGVVTDEETGDPLIGVTVRIKNSTTGTVTGPDGKFSLEVPEEAVLEVSFVGYTSRDVQVGNNTSLNISLTASATGLDQLVVVGYGTQRKADLTGSIDVVDVEELKTQPAASALEGLQGKASGVNIISDGAPGASPQIRIRGFSTINDNDPLYVIDGVPYRGKIGWLNSDDIESMQVLKDASAASIYGSRANNGVIMITTRQGRKNSGGPTVSLGAYYGFQKPDESKFPKMLNPQQYAEYLYTRYKNAGRTPGTSGTTGANYGSDPNNPELPEYLIAGTKSGHNVTPSDSDPSKYNYTPTESSTFYQITKANKEGTNWFKEITRTAPMENYDINISGGGENSTYAISGNYLHQEGTFKHTSFKRYSVRSNTSFSFFDDRVTIGENLTYSYTRGTGFGVNENMPGEYQGEDSPIGWANRIQTIIPVYDIMGNFAGTRGNGLGEADNPMAVLYRQKDNKDNSGRLFGSAYADVKIMDGLNFRSTFGLQRENYDGVSINYPNPERSEPGFENSMDEYQGHITDWTWSNTLNYKKIFNDTHDLNVLIGIESEKITQRDLNGHGEDFFTMGDMNYYYIDVASKKSAGSSGDISSLFSIFGKVDYNYKERYLASLTVRRDGSSNFGDIHRFGVFPAGSVAWRVSNEDFFNVSWINDLKIRAGYGITGNQNIPGFQYLRRFASGQNESFYPISGRGLSSGLWTTGYDNPDVKWEEAKTLNIGLDFVLFDNKLDGALEWFDKKTDGMLYPVPLPSAVTGAGSDPFINSGEMKNTGVEFNINYHYFSPVAPNDAFKFDIGVNFSSYKNEMLRLANGVKQQTYGSLRQVEPSIMRPGEPFGAFFGYKVIGIYQNKEELSRDATYSGAYVGGLKFEDINGDGRITADDRTIIGNPHPDFTYGVNFSSTYQNFTLSFALFGSQGNDIFDFTRLYTDFGHLTGTISKRVLNAWSPDNPNSKMFAPIDGSPTTMQQPNTYYIQDGSYLRLRNIRLGYDFGSLFNGNISNLNVYLRATNLFTITGYTGMDPQVNQFSSTFSAPGVDVGVYPVSRQFSLGVDIDF